MKRILCSSTLLFAFGVTAEAVEVELSAVQVGGFYADGATPDNHPTFQNYFVGYGTSSGGERTPERRSFFWFDLSTIEGEIHSATLDLTLVFGGLIYGKGPGDPAEGPVPDDPMEEFALSATPFHSSMVTSGSLTAGEIGAIFGSFAGPSIADPVVFMKDGPPPPETIEIGLNPLGLSFLNTKAGSEIILTGWMPTWSHDTRTVPGDPEEFFEGSELIFGHSNIHLGFPVPTLTISYTPVPEPASVLVLVAGVGVLIRRRRRR